MKPLQYWEYMQALHAMYPGKKIYAHQWDNYPKSIFFYDTPDYDCASPNIGIYTSETVYGLGPC